MRRPIGFSIFLMLILGSAITFAVVYQKSKRTEPAPFPANDPEVSRVILPVRNSPLAEAIDEQLRHAGEPPMTAGEHAMIGLAIRPKFQIGEVVRLKKIAGDMPERLIGQNAEIRSVDHGLYRVHFGFGELDYWASEDMLESMI